MGTTCTNGNGIPLGKTGTLQLTGRTPITFYAKGTESFSVIFTQFGGSNPSIIAPDNSSNLKIKVNGTYYSTIPDAINLKAPYSVVITGN